MLSDTSVYAADNSRVIFGHRLRVMGSTKIASAAAHIVLPLAGPAGIVGDDGVTSLGTTKPPHFQSSGSTNFIGCRNMASPNYLSWSSANMTGQCVANATVGQWDQLVASVQLQRKGTCWADAPFDKTKLTWVWVTCNPDAAATLEVIPDMTCSVAAAYVLIPPSTSVVVGGGALRLDRPRAVRSHRLVPLQTTQQLTRHPRACLPAAGLQSSSPLTRSSVSRCAAN